MKPFNLNNVFGQLKLTIDGPPEHLDPTVHLMGTYFGLSARNLVNSEVGSVFSYPKDLSGIALLNACGKKDLGTIEMPSHEPGNGVPMSYQGKDDQTEYKFCVVRND
jgi:hypothetical protein